MGTDRPRAPAAIVESTDIGGPFLSGRICLRIDSLDLRPNVSDLNTSSASSTDPSGFTVKACSVGAAGQLCVLS